MDRLGIIGASWRRLGTRGLERFTIAVERRVEVLPRLREALGASELLYLATCNRVEIVFARDRSAGRMPLAEMRRRVFSQLSGRQPELTEAESSFQAWLGEAALERLLMVAGGLDSAQLGEREIRGQLRQSLEQAQEAATAGPILEWAIARSMQLARQIERSTRLAGGRTSMPGLGAEQVLRHVQKQAGTVALVGVSAMTERCGEVLRSRGVPLLVVNRSEERGQAMAQRLGADFMALETFQHDPAAVAALVTATGAEQPIFDAGALERLVEAAGRAPLIVDFGVPPDVDPEAAERLAADRFDMQAISSLADASRRRRRAELAEARELVDDTLTQLRQEAAELALAPVMAELTGRYRQTAGERLERLFRGRLGHLGDDERQVMERFALDLAKRLSHVPVVGLKAVAREHGLEVADTFLSASDDERAWGLRDASAPGERS